MSQLDSSLSKKQLRELKGLRALVVRPEQQGGQSRDIFIEDLRDNGVLLHHCPVMRILPLESGSEVEQIKSYVLDFAQYDHVIFVSRTAAQLALDWLDRYWVMGPEGLPIGTHYYAVGKSTAAVLQSWNIEAVLPNQAFNSEGLLALPSLQQVSGQQVLIFSGVGGRQLLADELSHRGAIVNRCELYRRQRSDDFAGEINQLIAGQALDVVVIHSGELLDILETVISEESLPALCQLPVLVPGARVKKLAKEKGFETVICANSALPEDMVSALRGWYSEC